MRFRVRPAWAPLLAGVLAVTFWPGAASAQRRVRVSSVEITPAEAAIVVGQQQFFVPIAYDASNNPLASATFTYSSSNPRVATINSDGNATGVGPGQATITARTGTGAAARSATATLTVSAAPAVQQQGQPGAAQQPAPGAARTVAGRPTGPGYAAFDYQPEGSGAAEGLVMTPPRLSMIIGEVRQLGYRAVRLDGQAAQRVPIIFSVAPGGEQLIELDSVGVVRARGTAGQATVRVEVPGNPAIRMREVAVTVSADSVQFRRTQVSLSPGAVDTVPIFVPAQNRALDMRGQFQFSSSDTDRVRVLPLMPIITAVQPGTARISGESPYYSVRMDVTVHRPVVAVEATPADSSVTLAMAATQAFTLRALGSDGTPVTDAPLHWVLPDTSLARFDTTTLVLRGIGMGETRLEVSAPFSRDSLVRRIWRIRVVAGGLAASRARLGIGVGERYPVSVQLLDNRRQPIGPAAGLRWTSSNDSVARYVDGSVQGIGVGRARLEARTSWDSTVSVVAYVAGQVLVSAYRGGRWDLCAMTADSAPRFVPITADAAVELEPAWAPDLTQVAYVSAPPERPTSVELYVANADGSESRRVTNDSATVSSPVFVRPAGNQIVYQSNRGGRAQLYVINLDGTGRRQLTSGEVPNTQPDVSPDGSRVLFVSLRQGEGSQRSYDIWQMNIDGTGERRLTASPRPEDSPSYAPDGRSFYFLRDEGGSPATKRVYRQSLTDTAAAATPITPQGVFVGAYTVNSDGSLVIITRLEPVRGVGDVSRTVLFRPATGAMTNVQLGTGERLSGPVFRPATPLPR